MSTYILTYTTEEVQASFHSLPHLAQMSLSMSPRALKDHQQLPTFTNYYYLPIIPLSCKTTPSTGLSDRMVPAKVILTGSLS